MSIVDMTTKLQQYMMNYFSSLQIDARLDQARMYRVWCVATGGLIYYFMSGDNQQDFRNNNTFQPQTPCRDQDQATQEHFKHLSDEELDRQLQEMKKKRNS